jgi:hypothetical protein
MESMREILGGQKMEIIEQLTEDLRHAHRIIDDLLCASGRPATCLSCARPIMLIIGSTEKGWSTEKVYNYNGEPHRCPDPSEVPHE